MATTTFPRSAAQPLVSVSQPYGPEGGVWLLSMHHMPDNRLTPLLPALDFIELSYHRACEKGHKKGALVLTGERKKGKFFSNGLQLELVGSCEGSFWTDYYYKLLARVLTFPMQTIAAINGHCFAGGLCLALACDWRVLRSDRAWLSMNELLFGAPLPAGMASLLSLRLPTSVLSKVMLTAHRYVATDAIQDGLVDEVVEVKKGEDGSEATVRRAEEVARERAGFAESG
ncbi:hypothetical protein JCM1841_003479, partial [Sporobolomyces salmonicolor]